VEQALLKLARQLDSLDEASLVALWDKYFERVSHFEPSRRWEESVLVLSLIQAKRMKNQLFNCEWAARSRPGDPGPRVFFNLEKGPDSPADRKPTAKILAFTDAGNRPENRQPENGRPENDPAGKEPPA
jgi:hypothetical protein